MLLRYEIEVSLDTDYDSWAVDIESFVREELLSMYANYPGTSIEIVSAEPID